MAEYNETGSGGVIVGAEGTGVAVSGSGSALTVFQPAASGGVTIGGTSPTLLLIQPASSGGVVIGGVVYRPGYEVYHYPNTNNAIAPIIMGGTARIEASYEDDPVGGAFVTGTPGLKAHYNYLPRGLSDNLPELAGVSVGYQNEITPTLAKLTININIGLKWRVNRTIQLDYSIRWNTGKLRQYWYRIVGKGKADPCPPIRVQDPCCKKFILSVHARSIDDLCEKLKKRGWKWPIATVERYSKPAETIEIARDRELGINYECDETVLVEICNHPVCFDYCIDQDLEDVWGAAPTYGIFFEHEASGQAFVTGSADTSFLAFVYHASHTPTGGVLMSVNGTRRYLSSHYSYEGTGGVVIEPGPYVGVESSHWEYTGGVWPYDTGVITHGIGWGKVIIDGVVPPGFPTVFDQGFGLEEDDQPWIDYYFVDQTNEGRWAVSDLSYGRNSRYLVITYQLGQFRHVAINDIPANNKILGIKATINRHANTQVLDDSVVLVTGEPHDDEFSVLMDWTIISDSKAKGFFWPVGLDSVAEYGDVFDDWRDPNNPDYLGEWDVEEEIQNAHFGLAIRVHPFVSAAGVIASIDGTSLQIFYEEPVHQRIRMGGEARVTTSAYNYIGAGAVKVEGEAELGRVNRRLVGTGRGSIGPNFASITMGGKYKFHYHPTPTGGVVMGGAALWESSGFAYFGNFYDEEEGVVLTGGQARACAPNYNWAMEASWTVSGQVKYIPRYRYIAKDDGRPLLSLADLPVLRVKYTADTSSSSRVLVGGESDVIYSDYNYYPEGLPPIFVFGSADVEHSHLGTFDDHAGLSASIRDFKMTFGWRRTTAILDRPNVVIAACECADMPLTINFAHNLATNNKLAQFLVRNNYAISKIPTMTYNKMTKAWQSNMHFRGKSNNGITNESWDIVFELACTNLMGATVIGENVWKFSIAVVQKNLATGEDYDTRLIFGFFPDVVCSAGKDFRIQMTFDTRTGEGVVNPKSTIYQSLLYDNIGLFKNAYWYEHPDLVISVAQSGLSTPNPRQVLHRL